MRRLTADLAASLRNPEFWALSSWLDVVVRYRQSRLGIFWLVAPAIVYIWVLGASFSTLMGMPLVEFASHVGVGYLVFRLVSSVVTESTSIFAASSAFILDGHVRLTDFILRVIAKALFYFVASLPVLAVALAIFPDLQWAGLGPSLGALLLLVVNAVWIGMVCGLVGARFPDISQLVANIFMFAFLLTPIIWDASSMPDGSLRGLLMRMNPFFHMVESVRAPLLGDPVEMLTVYYLAAMTVAGWALAAFAYRRYAHYVPLWV